MYLFVGVINEDVPDQYQFPGQILIFVYITNDKNWNLPNEGFSQKRDVSTK